MEPLIRFESVSLFPDDEFGIRNVSLKLNSGGVYHILLKDEEKLNCLLGILEGRYRKSRGIIQKREGYFVQSDRLLMGDKVYTQEVEKYLNLGGDLFQFEGRKRSKHTFIDMLKAKSLTYFPIHRLRGDDKIKFTLLAMTFQRAGLQLFSRLLHLDMSEPMVELMGRIFTGSPCAVCACSSLEKPAPLSEQFNQMENMTVIDLTDC